MCGRYYIESDDVAEELRQIIEAVNRKATEDMRVKTAGEVFPTDVVPVLAESKAVPMKWGYSMAQGQKPVINARSETAGEKPMFRRSMVEARCLIPASGYYEWEPQDGRKQKRALYAQAPVIYMAGLYRQEKDLALPCFVILTRAAAPGIRHIHERMPVILTGEQRRAWLAGGADARGIIERAFEGIESRAV
ncbi:SOS response-associated peptidase [Bacillota bacterium Meth-B3]